MKDSEYQLMNEISLLKEQIHGLELRLQKSMTKLILQVALIVCATHGATEIVKQSLF
jgi:hypothetical protein